MSKRVRRYACESNRERDRKREKEVKTRKSERKRNGKRKKKEQKNKTISQCQVAFCSHKELKKSQLNLVSNIL